MINKMFARIYLEQFKSDNPLTRLWSYVKGHIGSLCSWSKGLISSGQSAPTGVTPHAPKSTMPMPLSDTTIKLLQTVSAAHNQSSVRQPVNPNVRTLSGLVRLKFFYKGATRWQHWPRMMSQIVVIC